VHEALQSRRHEEAQRRDEEHKLEHEADKYARDHLADGSSRQARADAKGREQKEKKAERHAALAECEHGKKACKICAPRHK
jgi:hypothetical protein